MDKTEKQIKYVQRKKMPYAILLLCEMNAFSV